MKSALAPATNVPMLPTTRDTAKVNGIHAAIGPGRAHALAAREVETQEPSAKQMSMPSKSGHHLTRSTSARMRQRRVTRRQRFQSLPRCECHDSRSRWDYECGNHKIGHAVYVLGRERLRVAEVR